MTGFILRSGLLGSLVVMIGAVTCWAAPLGERETFSMQPVPDTVWGTCQNLTLTSYAVKAIPGKAGCPPDAVPPPRGEFAETRYHPEVAWSGIVSPVPSRQAETSRCVSLKTAGIIDDQHRCPAKTGLSLLANTFQSLYEFVLPGNQLQKEPVGGIQLSYSGQQLLPYGGPRYRNLMRSDWSSVTAGPTLAPLMELLLSLFPEPGLRNLGVSEGGYQLEVSDTVTRFLPKLPIPTGGLELGDLIPFLLLLFLLPDYKKLCRGQRMLGRGAGRDRGLGRLAATA